MNIDKYPKSKELLRKKSLEALESFVDAFPVGEGFSKEFITEELINSTTDAMLENNPRQLYDFFDGEGIIIVPVPFHIFDKTCWDYNIGNLNYNHSYETRSECEKEAFISGFEILEARL